MNFVMDKDIPSKIRTDVIVLSDRDTGKLFNSKFRQIFIELPNFNKEEDECENDFERWIYILKHMDTLDRMPFKASKRPSSSDAVILVELKQYATTKPFAGRRFKGEISQKTCLEGQPSFLN